MEGSFALYQAFVDVYENKGYNQAAKALNRNDPASRSGLQSNVKKLEGLLNVRLFVSDKKGATPTPNGDRLYISIKKLLGQIEELENELVPFTEKSPFSIRVAIPPLFSITQFCRLICDFQSKYVKSEIEFFTTDCIRALKTKEADFVVSLKSELINKGFDVQDLYQDELVVLHNAESYLPTTNELVTDYSFVVSSAMNHIFYQRTGLEIYPRLKVDTLEQIYLMVKNGVVDCGLYWKTAADKDILGKDRLIASPIDEIENIDGKVDISCAYNKNILTKGQKAFLLYLKEHCVKLFQPFPKHFVGF